MTSNDPEQFRAVAIDEADGSIYVVGDAENSNIDLGILTLFDQDQGILMKFSRTGTLLWYVPIGGSDQETAETVALAPDGTVYVAGAFTGGCYFYDAGGLTHSGSLTSFSGSKDIYLAAYSPSGQFQFARQFGNGNDEATPLITADTDGVTLAASYSGSMTTVSGQSTAGALSTTGRSILLVRLNTSGTVVWTRSGGSSVADELSALVSDGTRIYVGYIGGQTPVRWYNGSGTQVGTSSATRNDHHITTFDLTGNWGWTRAFNDPSNNIEGPMRLVMGCGRLYAAGAVDEGTLIGNVAATGGTGNDYFFAARLVPTNGNVEWVRIGSTAATGNNFHPHAMAVGKYGTVHIGGSFAGSVQFQGNTITAGSGTDIFLLSVDANGNTIHFGGIPSNNDQQLHGMAADRSGGLAIAGDFRAQMALPGAPLTGPTGNTNAFMAWGQIGTRMPEFGVPSRFLPPGPPVCMSSGPHDLGTWMVPVTQGHAATVIAATSTTNTSTALGAPNGSGSTLSGNSASITLGLAYTLPSSEFVDITWRKTSGASDAVLSVAFSPDNATWTNASGTIRASRNTWITTRVAAPVDARYVRFTAAAGSSPAEIDAVYFAFGTMAGGTWSGTGVSGSTLNLSGVNGPVNITYTYGNGPCASSTTVQVQADNTPPVITCPGDTTVYVPANACTVMPEHGTITVTDDCNATAPLQIPQYTYMGTYGRHTYFRSWAALDWNSAKAAAMSFPNGHLVSLNTAEEEAWINSVLQAQAGSLLPIWTGLNDAATEGNFVWANGDPLTYWNWRSGQPDNSGDSDHAYMNMGGSPGWDDAHVSTQFNWIIEFDALPMIQPVLVSGPASGAPLALGVESITYSATDHAGNTATCSFQIAVIDTVRPVITCPANITVAAATGACDASVAFAATATDNCTAAPAIAWSHVPGSSFPVGSTIVTVTATDATGNAASCSFTVTVVDEEAPVITCPANITVAAAAGACDAAVTFAATVTDNCTAASTIAWSHAPGTSFPVGSTIVTVTATDAAGNVASCSFTVTVEAAADAQLGYGVSTVCALSGPIAPVTFAPAGGTFHTDGLDNTQLNANSGTLTPSLIPPGAYSIAYIVHGDCPDTAFHVLTVEAALTWYADQDGDGHGDPATSVLACGQPAGFVADAGDDCPFDPTKLAAGQCGCGNPDTDSDGDSIADCIDPCDNSTDGQPCDDGNAFTANDTLLDCACAGVPDSDGDGTPDDVDPCDNTTDGQPCDDGNAFTANDTLLDCVCAGVPDSDGDGIPDDQDPCDNTTDGQPCDDGNAFTANDTLLDCLCAGVPDSDGDGTPDDVDPCDNSTDGQPCDDGNAFTANDTLLDCACAGMPDSDGDGTPDDVDPCDNTTDGQPCDDGDPATINDTMQDCVCIGTPAPLDCAGVPNGSALPGTPCNDGDPMTLNDTWDANCTCAGTLVECSSEAGPDQSVCGTSATMQAVGTGSWTGSAGLLFSDPTSPVSAISADAAGSYEAWWTVTNGPCVAVDTVHITFSPIIDPAFHYAQEAYCRSDMPPAPWVAANGGVFSGSAGLSIDAVSGAIDVGNSQPGTYTVTHSFDGPCPASATVEVTIVAPPDAGWSAPVSICASSSPIALNDLITGTPGGTWSGQGVNNGVFNPAGLNGNVAITYTVINGPCTVAQEGTITVDPGPSANAGPDATVCGFTHTLAAEPTGISGTWSVPAGIAISDHTARNATITASAPGTYTLVWTTDNGQCTASDAVAITFHEPYADLFANAGPDHTIEVLPSTQLTGAVSPGASITWSVLQGPAVISSPHDSITEVHGLGVGANVFLLTATMGVCGHATDTVTITMKDLFVPQGFSPNGDGVNDTFEVTGMSAFPGSSLEVFNRWGQPVYTNSSYANEWDGRSNNGEALPDDTYFHVLNLTDGTTYKGYIVIRR